MALRAPRPARARAPLRRPRLTVRAGGRGRLVDPVVQGPRRRRRHRRRRTPRPGRPPRRHRGPSRPLVVGAAARRSPTPAGWTTWPRSRWAASSTAWSPSTTHGDVVRPALLWNDTRSAGGRGDLTAELGGPEAWAERVGLVPVASFTVTKLRWLAEHEPDAAARTAARVPPARLAHLAPGRATRRARHRPQRRQRHRLLVGGHRAPTCPTCSSAPWATRPTTPRVAAPDEVVGAGADGRLGARARVRRQRRRRARARAPARATSWSPSARPGSSPPSREVPARRRLGRRGRASRTRPAASCPWWRR